MARSAWKLWSRRAMVELPVVELLAPSVELVVMLYSTVTSCCHW
jgi:hypothetical protein